MLIYWCGPCRMAAPEVAKVAQSMAGKALVLKVNTKQEQQLSARYNICSIPNFAVFAQGQLQWQQAGFEPKRDEADPVALGLSYAARINP